MLRSARALVVLEGEQHQPCIGLAQGGTAIVGQPGTVRVHLEEVDALRQRGGRGRRMQALLGLLDELLELRERIRAAQEPVVDEEGGRALHARAHAILDIALDACLSGRVGQTGVILGAIGAQGNRLLAELIGGVSRFRPGRLVGKKPFVHGPEEFRILLARAVARLGGRQRIGMEFQREVTENGKNFTLGNVRFIQKRARLDDVTGAVRSLEVRVFDQLHRCLGVAAVEVAIGIHTDGEVDLGGRFACWRCGWTGAVVAGAAGTADGARQPRWRRAQWAPRAHARDHQRHGQERQGQGQQPAVRRRDGVASSSISPSV